MASSGSIMAVFVRVASSVVVRSPVMVTVAEPPASRAPRSQSTVPPVMEPTMMQTPLVVETDV